MSSASELKVLGNTAFQAGEFANAVTFFTQAIEKNASDHVLYSNRSAAYASLNKFQEALNDANVCIKLKSDWPKGYSRKGLALTKLDRHSEALEAYEEGLRFEPENAGLLQGLNEAKKVAAEHIQSSNFKLNIALTLMKNQKTEKYINEDPNYIDRVANIARLVALKKDVQKLQWAMSVETDVRVKEGLAVLFGIDMPTNDENVQPSTTTSEASQQQPTPVPMDAATSEKLLAEEKKNEGNRLYKTRNFDEALARYKEAQKLDPEEILYMNNEAAVYLERAEYDACIKCCEEALEKGRKVRADFTKTAKVYNRMAACYKKMGNLPKCIEMYKNSLIEDNDRKIRQMLRETERALDEKKRQDYIDPVKAEEHREKGNEYFRNKDYPNAKIEYDEAIKRNPKDARLASNRAATYLMLLEYPSALRDAEKSIELDPKFVKGWIRKGVCHQKLKEYHKAISAFQQGLQLEPENAECQKHLRETMLIIQSNQSSSNVDEEQVNRALGDPEIQEILRDPQFRMILEQLQKDPSRLKDCVNDEKIMDGLNKLMAAGIVRAA